MLMRKKKTEYTAPLFDEAPLCADMPILSLSTSEVGIGDYENPEDLIIDWK